MEYGEMETCPLRKGSSYALCHDDQRTFRVGGQSKSQIKKLKAKSGGQFNPAHPNRLMFTFS